MDQSQNVKDHLLIAWKQLYAEATVKELNPKGLVLEIGYGMGFVTKTIEKYQTTSYTVIIADIEQFKTAKELYKANPQILFIQGEWRSILPKLGQFDLIIYHQDDSLQDEKIMNYLKTDESVDELAQVNEVIKLIEKQMQKVHLKYSNEDIEGFFKKTGQFNVSKLPDFLLKLMDNGNITNEQYVHFFEKYHLKNISETSSINLLTEAIKVADPMLLCLTECLKNHLKGGSRFSFFIEDHTSRYEDSQFFDQVITNPNVDYQEKTISINLGDKPRDAMIPVITVS